LRVKKNMRRLYALFFLLTQAVALVGCPRSSYAPGQTPYQGPKLYYPGGGLPPPPLGVPTVGSVPYYSDAGTAWLTPGPVGQFVQSSGPGGNLVYSTISSFTPPPLAATWTIFNPGGGSPGTVIANSTWTSPAGTLPTVYLSDFSSGGTTNLHQACQVIPGADGGTTAPAYTLSAFNLCLLVPDQSGHNSMCAVGVRNTSGQIEWLGMLQDVQSPDIQVVWMTNSTTTDANELNRVSDWGTQSGSWWRIVHTTGAPGLRKFQTSSDGVNWFSNLSENDNAFMDANETWACIIVSPYASSGSGVANVSWTLTSP
jgi:hypothetical protein